jgi:hypothetical protein
MENDAAEFTGLVRAVLTRFFAQNGRAAPVAEIAETAANLWRLVVERGWPRPLATDEPGAPGGMADSECAPLVMRVLGGASDLLLADAAKQLVKACFYPEFKTCRDSFRERSPDGVCRRQQFSRALGRVSGVHCVDCPHWVGLEREAHERFLAHAWCGDVAEFQAHRDTFLPEDFRALQRWRHAAARRR